MMGYEVRKLDHGSDQPSWGVIEHGLVYERFATEGEAEAAAAHFKADDDLYASIEDRVALLVESIVAESGRDEAYVRQALREIIGS